MGFVEGMRNLIRMQAEHCHCDPGTVTVPTRPGAGATGAAGSAWGDDLLEPGPGRCQGGKDVLVTDHRWQHSDPSTWGVQQWMDAIAANPTRYALLFARMSAEGKLPDAVQDKAKEIELCAQIEVQEENRLFTARKSLMDADHETKKALLSFRV
jgi:hypothetical protein